MSSQQGLLLLQALLGEIAHDQCQRGVVEAALKSDRMQKTFAAFGGFRGDILRQPVDDAGCDLERVLHLSFGEARMNADALNGDGDAVSRERFVLKMARAFAVDGVAESCIELVEIDLVRSAGRFPRPA